MVAVLRDAELQHGDVAEFERSSQASDDEQPMEPGVTLQRSLGSLQLFLFGVGSLIGSGVKSPVRDVMSLFAPEAANPPDGIAAFMAAKLSSKYCIGADPEMPANVCGRLTGMISGTRLSHQPQCPSPEQPQDRCGIGRCSRA